MTLAPFQLIPIPERVTPGDGRFPIDEKTRLRVSGAADAELRALAQYGSQLLREELGIELPVSDATAGADTRNAIVLLIASEGHAGHPESYSLEVTEASITISAPACVGLFYGLQTLRQLVAQDPRSVPAVRIEDQPRFVYRGMHLDVGRHFFPTSFIKRYIDLISMYKMNVFHWHLTEDQGWRIEIEKYPRLTEVGAFRSETMLEKNLEPYVGDGIPHGGFYSRQEIREVVEHARRRYVTVVPEIEMPGHSTAALAAYPEFACTEGPFEVSTRWGVHHDIYCPTEETFAFLEDVLSEVIELFPGRYIHIGGDEAPKKRWEESATAQQVIRREGLADEHELQSYFIKRIERFLLQHGKRIIGWDEILEGGLAPEATVMSWRGVRGGIEAARQGHDVIMTPLSHVYFDYYQGDREQEPLAIGGYTPLEKVYEFEPVREELSSAEAAKVLGGQGNLWTEFIKTTDHVEYMVLPRMLALAETLWSASETRSWESFKSRLPPQLRRFDRLGLRYRDPGW